MTANLHVIRGTPYLDRLRFYHVLLDGKDIGKLFAKEEFTLPIAAGVHEISLRIDWCGSQPLTFTAQEGSDIWLECGNSFTGWKMIFVLFSICFYRNDYLWLKKTELRQTPEPIPASITNRADARSAPDTELNLGKTTKTQSRFSITRPILHTLILAPLPTLKIILEQYKNTKVFPTKHALEFFIPCFIYIFIVLYLLQIIYWKRMQRDRGRRLTFRERIEEKVKARLAKRKPQNEIA